MPAMLAGTPTPTQRAGPSGAHAAARCGRVRGRCWPSGAWRCCEQAGRRRAGRTGDERAWAGEAFVALGADGLGLHTNDDDFREIARQIEQQQPGWIVIWGSYTQQFVAFPLFELPSGTIVTARYPDALTDRMRRTERRFRRPPEKGES